MSRRVLVTGGASGLGLATVRRLTAAGANVTIVDLPSSNGAAVAEGGSVVPETSEKPMPACSNTAPSRRIRVRPPPPSRPPLASRVQASSTKRALPSAASMALQMRSCSPVR